ncbi:MAG: Glycosyl transferase family 2 [Candidatus Woesebacteria bacterium GW2011_GWB1_39_12]|uniref:Glycosyl transferase family 2 n=2 Tax=Candidatus Woeseibacteriota TaxID=1752722 RepID=A0A0G0LZY9_9BACT|nr:MAG: Glycosyl transferase family 2 [Candidatus Woesebacteria bacterium GW2011_GWA1_39_12]KKR00350.1 MAG: Glycosyl transferase family 2 [Candidatus Woesebacteria bacterium GW2011_GWB1_39_12]
MKPSIYLSIIIPCYNEEENLKRNVLGEVKKYMEKRDFSWEVIVSDDGSTDGSRILVKSQIAGWKNFKLLENPHGGKPSTLWFGIQKALGEYVLFTDMDQSTPIEELNKLLPFIEEKVGAIIGSRGLLRKNFPIYRKIGSIIFVALRKLFILPEIDDTQCGFKLFKKDVVLRGFPKLEYFRKEKIVKGWKVTSWDVELLHIVKKMGYLIEEVPVEWEDVDVSKSKGGVLQRYVRESKEMLTQILRVKLNDMRGLYKDI